MAVQIGIERYIPKNKIDFASDRVRLTTMEVEGSIFLHQETLDFPKDDPWSKTTREVISQIRREGRFIGQSVTELGIGDGRNIREAGRVGEVLGVDIERWRLGVASNNLIKGSDPLSVPVELWKADAVEFLQEFKQTGRERLSGWVIMCLPQSPSGENAADTYDGLATLSSYRSEWDKYGLSLNAATLDQLRQVASRDLRVLVTLNDRVPFEPKESMFSQTGWSIESQFQTQEPIQQDPDTGIEWVAAVDDGQRFYELTSKGHSPISAIEAERRRLVSLASGEGRDGLNVYHNLTIFELTSRR